MDVQMELDEGGEVAENIYNAWLPVAQESKLETQRFHDVVGLLQSGWREDYVQTRFTTLKWIPVIDTFLKAKSPIAFADLEVVVKTGLDVVLRSSDKFFIQARWSQLLSKILKKFRNKLNIRVEWRPLHSLISEAHFKRRQNYDGLALKQIHLETLTTLVRHCRRFFPPTASVEIWNEFRPAFEDLSHNSSLEAAGFVCLFLPNTLGGHGTETGLLTKDWLNEVFHIWAAMPNCRFWNYQWAYLLSRIIKHSHSSFEDWEDFVPILFTFYLQSFDVPVGRASATSPVQREIPREVMIAFISGWSFSASKVNAKSIVFLIKQSGAALHELETLVDLLEQYFHPSNGGSWTSSLEQFLQHLVQYFLKRLAGQRQGDNTQQLGEVERATFVKAMLHLIDRGQYSKNPALASTAANAAASLAFVEPTLVLPLLVSRFYSAMDTITATHQLQRAVTSLALGSRAIILASAKEEAAEQSLILDSESATSLKETLVMAMFNTLMGLDANDPPKTLATMQFYCSVFSSIGILGDESDGGSAVLPLDWLQWLNEFLSRLFTLLVHLEPSSQSSPETDDSSHLSSKTFLMQGGSFYHHVLELMFGRLTKPLYQQAVRKVGEFIHGQVLPGALAEIGFLCSAAVYANPAYAVPQLLEPLMNSVLSALADTPSTGFSGQGSRASSAQYKVGLSPGLESSVSYQLNVLLIALTYGGSILLQYKDLLVRVMTAAFDAPSIKVNEAGSRILTSVLSSMVLFYPIDQYKVVTGSDGIENWMSSKDISECPVWHIPDSAELAFANHLLSLHLEGPIADLHSICDDKQQEESSGGQAKEKLRVLLLRVDASLRGVRSCLPDFQLPAKDVGGRSLTVAGATGATVGSRALREETADTLHTTFKYLFGKRADDTGLLMLLIRVMDMVVNYGWTEYGHWLQERQLWRTESKCLSEPKVNYITNADGKGKRRPRWLVVEMVYAQNALRASQAGYRYYSEELDDFVAPPHVPLLLEDLLVLSLHRYDAVRTAAGDSLVKVMKRFPKLVKNCIPMLTSSLQDTGAIEETAIGACQILTSRSVLRHLMQDWNDLVAFLMAILNSSHHDSVKAQAAINELFIVFNVRFGGLPAGALHMEQETTGAASFAEIVLRIKNHVGDEAANVHWRYNIMAQAMLLLMVVPETTADKSMSSSVQESKELITGQFLSNLKSELPPLRPLSVAALLLLLQPAPFKLPPHLAQKNQAAALCAQQGVISTFQEGKVADKMVSNLGFDHTFSEGTGRSVRSLMRSMPELGLTALLPSFLREWPRTRTWDAVMNGEAFSSSNAKLFKRLVQEGGDVVLSLLRRPLEEAVDAVDERGKQCVAAELVAGLLHADVQCVVDAWSVWMRTLLRKALLQSTVESAPEWAACVRFAVTGKGRLGHNAPLLRSQVLGSLVEPLAPSSASTSLVTKRLMFLRAALVEVSPGSWSTSDAPYQASILAELMTCMTHPAAQVREGVGNLMCVVASNLTILLRLHEAKSNEGMGMDEEGLLVGGSVKKWTFEVVEGATAAAAKIQAGTGPSLGGTALAALGGVGPSSSSNQDNESTEEEIASKWMETTLYFVIASVKSGRAIPLNNIIVGLLQPILSIQETSDKELSALAKRTLQLLNSAAPYDIDHVGGAVAAVLGAANDTNWHTRVSALTFLQSLVYRHAFILTGDAADALWRQVQDLLSDSQLEVREAAATTLSGMLKGTNGKQTKAFREQVMVTVTSLQASSGGRKSRKRAADQPGLSTNALHGIVLGLAACVLSVPYDMPSWLPEMVTQLIAFNREPAPIRSTVTKTIAEFDVLTLILGVFRNHPSQKSNWR